MIGGEISDGGGGIASPVAQVEKDVGARLDWAGCGGLRMELGDSLTADGILLIVKGDDNLCGIVKMLSPGRKKSPTKNTKSVRGQNWTVQRWSVQFAYLQDRKQK